MATNQSDLSRAQWRKSTRSGGNGDCVEVAALGAWRGVRDSKDQSAGILTFCDAAWRDLVEQIKSGAFDL